MFRLKRYSAEQADNLIMGDALPSDTKEDFDDLSSSASHLSTESESDSFSESSETDEDHNEATGTTRCTTVRGKVRPRGGNRAHLIRSADAYGPATLSQIPKQHNYDTSSNWIHTPADPQSFPFTGQPGLLVDIPENPAPSFFLELLLTQELLEYMVDRTNIYAEKVISEKIISRRSRFNEWKPTNVAEMKTFIGLMVHMGVINLPNLQDYWSPDPFLQTNNIWKSVMSRDRFLLLLRFWHFEEPDATESRLQKISPLMDHLNNTMAAIYCPDQHLSLDESMVLWRGRLLFRQYIKNKRHKC